LKVSINRSNEQESYFAAVIEESHDYHEFGMEMNGRGFSGSYRFGYQGSEKDNEVSGDGNSYTTEFRQLDPRLGRWFSVDPVFQPWQSPYTSMDNNPINLNDPMGLDPKKLGSRIFNRDKLAKGSDKQKKAEQLKKDGKMTEQNFGKGQDGKDEKGLAYWDEKEGVYYTFDKEGNFYTLSPAEQKIEITIASPYDIINDPKNAKTFEKMTSEQKAAFSTAYDNVISKAFGGEEKGEHSANVDLWAAQNLGRQMAMLEVGKVSQALYEGSDEQAADKRQAWLNKSSGRTEPVIDITDFFMLGAPIGIVGELGAASTKKVFWSGAKKEAQIFAKETGGTTLEMTTAGILLDGLTKATSYGLTRPLWKLASRTFAGGARGSVTFVTFKVAPEYGKIWLGSEKPILEANKVVINVIFR
jgi:RHS repeat-associated protein